MLKTAQELFEECKKRRYFRFKPEKVEFTSGNSLTTFRNLVAVCEEGRLYSKEYISGGEWTDAEGVVGGSEEVDYWFVPGHLTPVFENVSMMYTTKDFGNFKPTAPEFFDNLERVRQMLGLQVIFAPSLAFTKRTASLTDQDEQMFAVTAEGKVPMSGLEEGIVRTDEKADGGIIFFDKLPDWLDPTRVAIAGFNADCPFVIGFDIERNALFMLHAGLGCIHQKGQTDKQTIIDNLAEKLELNPNAIRVYVTPGIQQCCYGRDDDLFDEVADIWGKELLYGRDFEKDEKVKAQYYRKGQPALNLSGLIKKTILHARIPRDRTFTGFCTCHEGSYWSNVRGDQERNLVLIKLSS